MLLTFQTKSFVVRRLRVVSGNRRAFYATTTADGDLQNIDLTRSGSTEGIASKTYKAWFDIDMNVLEGDQLTDQDTGIKYKVIAVEKLGQGLGLQAEHLEVVLTRFTDN